jgi:uncharacterized membrane protein YwaF
MTFETILDQPIPRHYYKEEAEEIVFEFFFELSDKEKRYHRVVYSFLNLLRDLGGLRGALMWVIVGRTSAISKIFFNNAFVNANYEYLSRGME